MRTKAQGNSGVSVYCSRDIVVLALPVNTGNSLGTGVEPVSMILSHRPEPTAHLVKQ